MKGHLLVVGLGHSQVDLARVAKDCGLQVSGVGTGAVGPAAAYCDALYDADILDARSLEAVARSCEADALFTLGMERALMPIAQVSEALGLPTFFGTALLRKLEDKGAWRQLLEGLPGNLPFQLGENPVDFEGWSLWPAVIKPSDGSGQRGVAKVNDFDELQRRLPAALASARNGKALLEAFAGGDELSVNLFLQGGKKIFSLTSDRFSYADLPGGIVKAHGVPSRYDSPAVRSQIDALVDGVIHRLGFKDGHIYFQLKVDGEKVALIEFTPRFDGCHMWHLIERCTGVNLVRAALQLLFEGRTAEFDRPWKVEPYFLRFVSAPSDAVMDRDVYIPSSLKGCEGIHWYYGQGDRVKRVTGYLEKAGYGIVPGVFCDDCNGNEEFD